MSRPESHRGSVDGILAPNERCAAVWRRMVSRPDPDINFADRVLAERAIGQPEVEGEVIAEDAEGNKTFQCARYDTVVVDLGFEMPSGARQAFLCGLHRDIRALWKAERELGDGERNP